jgi:hypothetical protein
MIAKAILAINPTARFQVVGTIDNIIWYDETTPIAKADIEAKITELQADFDAEQWKRNRQKEYPDAIECVHALLDGGDTLTDLQTKRTTIKEKYPKE